MTIFDQAFAVVVGAEGGFTANPADPGNWTSGRCGAGECRGTKFGISASAYPRMDIAGLTIDQAKAIYWTDYWAKIAGDQLPAPVALLAFDAAVNNGVRRSALWVQAAVGAAQDGQIGPATVAAVNVAVARDGGAAVCAEMLAHRLAFMAALPTWTTFGLGWARRLCRLPFDAVALVPPNPS